MNNERTYYYQAICHVEQTPTHKLAFKRDGEYTTSHPLSYHLTTKAIKEKAADSVEGIIVKRVEITMLVKL